jgi:hypothetical protein
MPVPLLVGTIFVILDIGIVIGARALLDAVPGFEAQRELISIKDEFGINPIPAARQRLPATIGLVCFAEVYNTFGHAKNVIIGQKRGVEFRFVVCFAKRSRDIAVEELPVGHLRIAEPQVGLLIEHVIGQLGLHAELELDFIVIDLISVTREFIRIFHWGRWNTNR